MAPPCRWPRRRARRKSRRRPLMNARRIPARAPRHDRVDPPPGDERAFPTGSASAPVETSNGLVPEAGTVLSWTGSSCSPTESRWARLHDLLRTKPEHGRLGGLDLIGAADRRRQGGVVE